MSVEVLVFIRRNYRESAVFAIAIYAPIDQKSPYLMHPRGEEEFTSATEPTSNGQQPAVRKLDQLRIQDEENNNKNAA
ncbi:hypothetical protein CDAR_128021 [Caerostris darwini]|uniref:Uncharacterized protein n=1 Tax=Caerostris darwini TaxID=1538125 RepID=A0AAV4P442_9ARAC|nr:hypothetical protein CDAR_128021 [Caerostris darwini]